MKQDTGWASKWKCVYETVLAGGNKNLGQNQNKTPIYVTGVSQVIKFTCEVTDFKLGVHVCKSKHGSLHFINSMQLFLVTLKCTEVSTTFQVFVFK